MTQLTTIAGIVPRIEQLSADKITLGAQILIKESALNEMIIATGINEEIQELKNQMKLKESESEELKEAGKQILLATGAKKFEGLNGVTVQLNKTPDKLVITNKELIPQDYYKTVTTQKINNADLKEDLKNGVIVDGAELQHDFKFVVKTK